MAAYIGACARGSNSLVSILCLKQDWYRRNRLMFLALGSLLVPLSNAPRLLLLFGVDDSICSLQCIRPLHELENEVIMKPYSLSGAGSKSTLLKWSSGFKVCMNGSLEYPFIYSCWICSWAGLMAPAWCHRILKLTQVLSYCGRLHPNQGRPLCVSGVAVVLIIWQSCPLSCSESLWLSTMSPSSLWSTF
jgi:hypothetical protein